ncbi:MAG: peptidoglycan-binding domain-containing protein [Candidatus Omnitrophota bacterium]|jgi:hypothetical protein
MFKKLAVLAVGFMFLLGMAGCGTAKRKQMELENQGLKNQVSVLESQVQSKDEELNTLKDQLGREGEQKTVKQASAKKTAKNKGYVAKKMRSREMEIQIALRNAGFDPGIINGVIGKQTIIATKGFQKASNLKVTGQVNKRTWKLLKTYLKKDRRVKSGNLK